ncbi:hypothetical protein K8R47_00005, partial [archaeon]|nr:hypothetical protein [archaeon]
NLIPFILDMTITNEMAKQLISEYNFRGTASSDSHNVLNQIRTSGIYVPEENLNIEALKEHIKTGNFEKHEQYIDRFSFLLGHFG